MNSQSQGVAKSIISKLIEAKLVCSDDEETLIKKLAEGKMKQEDWRLAVEKGIDAEEGS
jgi:hypothetical protein